MSNIDTRSPSLGPSLKFSSTFERRPILADKQRVPATIEACASISHGLWESFNLKSTFLLCSAFSFSRMSIVSARRLQFYVQDAQRRFPIRKFNLRLTAISCGTRELIRLRYHGSHPKAHVAPGELLSPRAMDRFIRLGSDAAPYIREELYLTSEETKGIYEDCEDPAKCLFLPKLSLDDWIGRRMVSPSKSILQVVLRIDLLAVTDNDAELICNCTYSEPFEVIGNSFAIPDFDNLFYDLQSKKWRESNALKEFEKPQHKKRAFRIEKHKRARSTTENQALSMIATDSIFRKVKEEPPSDDLNSSLILADSPKVNIAPKRYFKLLGSQKNRSRVGTFSSKLLGSTR